jgi:YVTN family beta-propeller protein
VIDTASKMVVATVSVGSFPDGLAVTPNGKRIYVVGGAASGTVSVIDTATNTVTATIPVGAGPLGVAITPDGKHAYVLNDDVPNNFWVIDTTTRTVVAMVPGGTNPAANPAAAVAVTPDGKHAYVVQQPAGPGSVSVLRTATNTVVATVPVGVTPEAVGIVPPPPGVPFLAFSVTALAIDFDGSGSPIFNLHSQFTLSSTAPAINPVTQPVTLQVGTFSTTFPPGSFAKQLDGSFTFAGVIEGVSLKAQIRPAATWQYTFHAKATAGASLTGTANPVYLTLIIGGDSGATSVTAAISP